MSPRCSLVLLVMFGCANNGFEVSVDLKTDFLPGRQFVVVTTEVFIEEEAAPKQNDAIATSLDNFLEGSRVADFEGLPRGTYRVRVTLLTPMGRVLSTQETILELREDFAVTILVTSNCREIRCPMDDASLTSCIGGICVDPRCTPQAPEFCQDVGCATDDQCAAGSDCTTGACIDGFCFVRPDALLCGTGFYCDLDDGCLADLRSDAGACNSTETNCSDGLDEDCDGDTDCADSDCGGMVCDDGNDCTSNDVCSGVTCGGESARDCDDGDPCTDDTCTAEEGCVHADNAADCDDGLFCNGTDRCESGVCIHENAPCEAFCNEATAVCEACANASDCGEVVAGPWSSCGGFDSVCDAAGTETRSIMTPRCASGVCEVVTTMESRSCARATEGNSCGTTMTGAWSACGGFTSTCDTAGTRSRNVTTYACGSGTCRPNSSSQNQSCTRATNGVTCGATTYSAWGSCGGFANSCDEGGTRRRNRTVRVCSSSSCRANVVPEDQNCSRNVNDGTSCGSFWQRCCGGSCTNLANNTNSCGACRVNCGSLPCTANNGGYACSSCSSNATCRGIYNSAATCYLGGGNRCNCQCGSNGVCADGGCGAGFYCHDVPGNNFCSPSP